MKRRFYQDAQWYSALLLAPVFWGLYSYFVNSLGLKSVFDPLHIFLLSVLLYPIVEEIVFRGLLQGYLSRWKVMQKLFIRFSFANILTSILFAFSHLFNQSFFWAVLVFFPSLVFGYFKDRHQSVVPCIILHSAYNLVFFSLTGL